MKNIGYNRELDNKCDVKYILFLSHMIDGREVVLAKQTYYDINDAIAKHKEFENDPDKHRFDIYSIEVNYKHENGDWMF